MTECNHDSCETPFCPSCGDVIDQSSLFSLLRHLKSKRHNAERDLEQTRTHEGQRPEEQRWGSRIPKKQSLVAKWDTWINALESLIVEERKARNKK